MPAAFWLLLALINLLQGPVTTGASGEVWSAQMKQLWRSLPSPQELRSLLGQLYEPLEPWIELSRRGAAQASASPGPTGGLGAGLKELYGALRGKKSAQAPPFDPQPSLSSLLQLLESALGPDPDPWRQRLVARLPKPMALVEELWAGGARFSREEALLITWDLARAMEAQAESAPGQHVSLEAGVRIDEQGVAGRA